MKLSNTAIKNYFCSVNDLADLKDDINTFVEFFNFLKSAEVWGREASWYGNQSLDTVTITYRNSNGIRETVSTKKDLGWKLQEIKHFEWKLVNLQF